MLILRNSASVWGYRANEKLNIALIGLGAKVLPGLSIGSHCTIAAGAVVTRNIPDNSKFAGIPAKPL